MATTKTPTNLDTLIINYLTQADFDAEVSGGTLDANQLYLTPDSSITEVAAGTGLQGGGTSGTVTLNHKNSTTAKTTQAVYPIAFDAQGHITSSGNAVTIPSAYTLPVATYNTLGGVKPWKSYTASATGPTAATASTAVSVNAITNTASRYYAVEMDKDGRMFVNVPWTNVNSSYITTDTNTTYTLTNALSSHKFTWTFTAGGSGSGYTTTTAELVAGTGISLTDDATNKKITIASTIVNTDEQLKIEEVFDSTTQTYIYYPILGRSTTTTGVRQIDTDGFQYYNRNGTTSAEGIAQLTLGNATTSGVAGNKPGSINLFSSTAYAGLIKTGALTAARTYSFPNKSGTVALIEDLTNVVYLTDEGNVKIDGTIAADQGIFNKLIATNAEIENLNVDDLTAQNATIVGLLDVEGNLHTNTWTNSNIATIQGNFYIAPTVKTGKNYEQLFQIAAIDNPDNEAELGWWIITLNGTNILKVPALESDTSIGEQQSIDTWSSGSEVMITGTIIKNGINYPLGTLKGILSNNLTTSGAIITQITDDINNNPATLQEIGAGNYGYDEIKISLYKRSYENQLYPLGILMSAQGRESKSFIDIYGGGNIQEVGYLERMSSETHEIQAASSDYGGLAMPRVRIGNLRGLPNIRSNDFKNDGFLPTGWGIYTDNGFFNGTIVSNNGLIGGFTLDKNSITNGNLGDQNSVIVSIGTESTTTIGNSGNISNWAFAAGENFGVTTNGELHATAADITGIIDATKLVIGRDRDLENRDGHWEWDNDGLKFININSQPSIAITNNGAINADMITTGTLSGDLIKGGTLELGYLNNNNGILKIYAANGASVGQIDNNGFVLYGPDGGRILMSYNEGFAGYNNLNQKVYWSNFDDFSMKKSVVEEEIILSNKARFISMQITDDNNNIINDGIGIVPVGGNN